MRTARHSSQPCNHRCSSEVAAAARRRSCSVVQPADSPAADSPAAGNSPAEDNPVADGPDIPAAEDSSLAGCSADSCCKLAEVAAGSSRRSRVQAADLSEARSCLSYRTKRELARKGKETKSKTIYLHPCGIQRQTLFVNRLSARRGERGCKMTKL